ncbi:rCG25038, partial [Rattus norvegicus]
MDHLTSAVSVCGASAAGQVCPWPVLQTLLTKLPTMSQNLAKGSEPG